MNTSSSVGPKQALVLFSYRSHKRGYIEMLFERLQAASSERNLRLSRGSLSDMRITIKDSKLSIVEALTGKDLVEFDVTYFELWYKAQQQALAAALYLQRHNKAFFSRELLTLPPLTKVGELAVLADQDVPIPDSFISNHRQIKQCFKNQPPIDFPLVLKAADGYGGKNNFLVKDYAALVDILDRYKDLQFVMQEFIPNDCDYRCLVFGGEIKLVLKRTRDQSTGSHLNNTSAGATGELVAVSSLSEPARQAVLRAAEVLNRSEFAGVDLLLNAETGQPYILEVNQTPQIEIGAEVDAKMAALLDYIERRAA